jgi:hypothetical protein
MAPDDTSGFSWGFIDEMTWWALGLATTAGLFGAWLLQQPQFLIGCMIAVIVDISLVRAASHHVRQTLELGQTDSVGPLIMVVGRLLVKAALLLAAIEFPDRLSFAGTVVGALAYDVTLTFVGSIVAAMRFGRGSGHRGVSA